MSEHEPAVAVDAVDAIEAAWRAERPDLDLDSIGIVTRIWRIGRRLDAQRSAVLGATGIDGSTLDLLSTLRRSGPPYELTPREIEHATLITSGGVSQRLAKSEQLGYVERRRASGDGRSVTVRLTTEGKQVLDVAVTALFENEQRLVELLDPDRRADLRQVLREFLAALDDAAVPTGDGR